MNFNKINSEEKCKNKDVNKQKTSPKENAMDSITPGKHDLQFTFAFKVKQLFYNVYNTRMVNKMVW